MRVTRLAPSHGGGSWIGGAPIVEVEETEAAGVPEVAGAEPRFVFGQLDGGMPGSEVNRQQATRPDTEKETATAAASPAIIKMTETILGRMKACNFCTRIGELGMAMDYSTMSIIVQCSVGSAIH